MKKNLIKLIMLGGLFFFTQSTNAQNALTDGSFSSTTSITPFYTDPPPFNIWCSWGNLYGASVSFTTDVTSGTCSYYITNGGTVNSDVQLIQWGFPLNYGNHYRLSFEVKADLERSFGVYVGENEGTWRNLNVNYTQYASTEWQTKTIEFDAWAMFGTNKLSFEMGAQNISMYFRNIYLQDMGPGMRVVIPGTFQASLGCVGSLGGNWEPNCDFTALGYQASTGQYIGTFKVPAGCQQYKVAIGGSWSLNYGENGVQDGPNIKLFLPQDSLITFTYDPYSHLVQTSPVSSGFNINCLPTVVLAGSFQTALGCTGDWDPACTVTALAYNQANGMFEADWVIPAGCYEYRVTLNGGWIDNYGKYGSSSDPNYILSIPGNATQVHFAYDPVSRLVNALYNANFCQPNTAVIAGSFQSALGCASNWQADCDNTRMQYDPINAYWVDTLNIPAGSWAFKVTLNNSWAESYGLYGGSDNIPLDLCYPAKVVFRYYHTDFYHDVWAQVITNGICLTKFYDANVNGNQDFGEPGMGKVRFRLEGNGIIQHAETDSNGKTAFTNLPNGVYVIKECVPPGYYPSVVDSQYAYVFDGLATVNFGNVCLGAGGGRDIDYWTSREAESKLNEMGMETQLSQLRMLNLRNHDGTDFDPNTYKEFRNWLRKANEANMAYELSAQLSVMYLNLQANYVDYNAMLYTHGCGYSGPNMGFISASSLLWQANYDLWNNPQTREKNPDRKLQECMASGLESANNNRNFVQTVPCSKRHEWDDKFSKRTNENSVVPELKAAIWPNPSSTGFTLRPATDLNGGLVYITVYDATGKKIFTENGGPNKDYHFGENFISGVYFVEVIQNISRSTFRLVKQ